MNESTNQATKDTTMTIEDFYTQQLRRIIIDQESNTEERHRRADDLLCDLLLLFECGELVRLYKSIDKWYA